MKWHNMGEGSFLENKLLYGRRYFHLDPHDESEIVNSIGILIFLSAFSDLVSIQSVR